MVKVQRIGADTNATFGEDGNAVGASFVPKLGRLGKLDRLGEDFYTVPKDYVSLPEEPAPFYTPAPLITPEEQARVDAEALARANAPWPWGQKYNMPVVIGAAGLLTLGIGIYFVTRQDR